MNLILFLAGLICGACFSVVFLFGLQVNRTNRYKEELRQLREKEKE